ncbi:peptidylprolyl isomerase [Paenibacillus sp. GCM10027627]|uniref:peptidylprolyl isomerase n=1 Tax=unclassified Paenibacillus TaxID=185978 RepID=UPI00362F23B7
MTSGRIKVYRSVIVLMSLLIFLAGCGKGNGGNGSNMDGKSTSSAKTISWNKMPEMSIDLDKRYEATIRTTKGVFTMELFSDKAPVTVNNFVFLAKQGFYEGLTFHSVIESFMIQTGDPKGNGTGTAGYRIPDELDSEDKYTEGTVAMFNAGSPNSGSSQFFICTGPDAANLNQQPNYTIFGKVNSGMEIVKAIASTPVKDGAPLTPVVVESITIKES